MKRLGSGFMGNLRNRWREDESLRNSVCAVAWQGEVVMFFSRGSKFLYGQDHSEHDQL